MGGLVEWLKTWLGGRGVSFHAEIPWTGAEWDRCLKCNGFRFDHDTVLAGHRFAEREKTDKREEQDNA